MARPESLKQKARVPLAEKVKCLPKRGWAHHWICEDPQDGIVIARCKYCRRRKDHPAALSEYERFERVVINDPRPQPSTGIYRPGAWSE